MTQNSLHVSFDITNLAEGSPHPKETQEPKAPLRTSTMPIIQTNEDPRTPSGETGVNDVVNLAVEGNDDNETQDANRPDDETHPQREAEAVTMTEDTTQPILIVEDTVELAEVIQATLENMGLASVHETHGKNGLERLKEFYPAVVLMDIGLPDITGWKMLDGIKDHARKTGVNMPKIIVITAYGDPANRLVGKLQGIHSYLIKPFTPDQVERLVTAALNNEEVPDLNDDIGADTNGAQPTS